MTDTTFLQRYGRTPQEVAAQLQQALQDFEVALALTFDRWLIPVADHLATQGAAGDFRGLWSPAQQAEHVVKANTGFSKVIYLLGSERELPPVPKQQGPLHEGRPVAPANFEPGPGSPWAELEPQWRQVNARLITEVERINPDSPRTFWHPYLQDLTALDWARSTVMHTRRHHKQLGVPR